MFITAGPSTKLFAEYCVRASARAPCQRPTNQTVRSHPFALPLPTLTSFVTSLPTAKGTTPPSRPLCERKRQRSACKDCGGASICEHNRRRSICKDCGGASICAHRRLRSRYKDCKRRACRLQLAAMNGCSACMTRRTTRRAQVSARGSCCRHRRSGSSPPSLDAYTGDADRSDRYPCAHTRTCTC